MALSDTATLAISTGKFYTAATGTANPTTNSALLAPAGPWAALGHTSIEDILSFASDGGDSTVLSTLQNRALRTKKAARVESFSMNLQQVDLTSLKLYFGSNMAEISTGSIFSGVPNVPVVTTSAFLAVFQDDDTVFAVYAPKAEIFRGDDLDLSGVDVLASLPITITPLVNSTNVYTYAVTPLT